jgi:hypothetical protein
MTPKHTNNITITVKSQTAAAAKPPPNSLYKVSKAFSKFYIRTLLE